ncbi:DNA methylase N-4/N-6 domain protein [Sideroxydans lithotrophicus ES-1] [Mycobacterium shimoidei]|uniref:DNA methylase N-4/N-6 domain protein [Sideroxydans lithotrophicus ES-1] n=1 Tax=Mycobacterium shimoidei TaxID=29313 RepID=A0A375YXV6_MYCSH|nr:hypothetical protein [Mycobacterium shimoidei]SRX93585.1 DNA methylase N-4/N-6 domain protein [Sideroxydans lithotrophicus ES-1] [Mycobacterium shimoidei]
MKPYAEFLADKVRFDTTYGHDIDPGDINPILKPHQRDIVQWAARGGRRAIFAAFGLGKSVMQLYFFDGVKYLQAEERQRDMPSLFDLEAV